MFKRFFLQFALLTFALIALNNVALAEQCIKPDELKSGKIIVNIEAPLPGVSSTSSNSNTNFEVRSCVRNTYVYNNSDGKISTVTELLTDCNSGGTPENLESGADLYADKVLCEEIQVILSDGGTTLIEGYIATIYRFAAGFAGLIATLIIIISGLQIALSGGDSGAVDSAKGRIITSLSGLALLFLSAIILYTINPNFFFLA